jgi:large subunit ribosomal protein L23
MALFSKKENTEEVKDDVVAESTIVETPAKDTTVTETTLPATLTLDARASRSLVVPRLSEKAGAMNKLNKYVFTVFGKSNKIEVKKIVETAYGVKIAGINMITMAGKRRRFGRRTGITQAYKKAIVTLTPNSKKIDLVEPS